MNSAIPKVGFASLGCPKATVDSEYILTRLRAEGYLISGSYRDADLVPAQGIRLTPKHYAYMKISGGLQP